MSRCCGEEAGQPLPDAPTRHLEAMQIRYRCVKLGNGTWRKLVFTIRYELQARCTSERFYIRNTDEYHFMYAGLQPAGQRSHWIQVTDNGQTHKTDFHGNS